MPMVADPKVEKTCMNCGTICEGHKDVMACASSVIRANWTPIAIKEKKNAS